MFDIVELERITPLGEDLDIDLRISNKGEKKREVDVKMTATLVWYNGVNQGVLKTQSFDAECDAGACEPF